MPRRQLLLPTFLNAHWLTFQAWPFWNANENANSLITPTSPPMTPPGVVVAARAWTPYGGVEVRATTAPTPESNFCSRAHFPPPLAGEPDPCLGIGFSSWGEPLPALLSQSLDGGT